MQSYSTFTWTRNQFNNLIDWFRSDGRHFQIISQLFFLAYGIFALGWDADGYKYLAAMTGCLGMQYLGIRYAGLPVISMRSALITTLGLCLLFKANHPVLFLFAGILAIGQKLLVRVNGKHLWNPANFGIVCMILLTGQGWVSPGQWGSGPTLVFIIGACGLGVLSRVKRLETGFIFIATYAILEYSRTVLFLGWGHDVWLHKLSGGSFWLFALFMITDPMTTPDKRAARITWVIATAVVSFYIATFHFVNAAPIWVLFFATPFVPIIDKIFSGKNFQWVAASPKNVQISKIQ